MNWVYGLVQNTKVKAELNRGSYVCLEKRSLFVSGSMILIHTQKPPELQKDKELQIVKINIAKYT